MKNIIYITIFSIIIMSCSNTTKQAIATTEDKESHKQESVFVTKAQFENNEMNLGNLTEYSFPLLVKVTGMIDVPPQNKEVISTFYGGYIKNSPLLIGDKVKKGQALVTIQNPEFIEMQQNYLELVEQLVFLKSEYARQKTLFDEKITSHKNYLKAESDYKINLAMYNGMRKKLQMLHINPTNVEQGKISSKITLYSSINGSITKINVSKGTYVSPADAIMEIVNTEHIHIELAVFEKDVMNIKEGQKINFKVSEASNTIYDAEVHLVGTSIDENTRTIKVHGHLHDEDDKPNFAIGMFVDAEIEITNTKKMGIPEDAVVELGKSSIVLVLEKLENEIYNFKVVEVEIGKKHNGLTEIKSSEIKPNDQILIKGAYNLVE